MSRDDLVHDLRAKLAAAEADRDERLRVQVAEKHEALRLMDKAYQRADALAALVREAYVEAHGAGAAAVSPVTGLLDYTSLEAWADSDAYQTLNNIQLDAGATKES